ncbi:MAG: EAL domain-containing protein [Pseudomonadales bacterium]|nr:EAL domain-containing protein [Pseudomonadales bacterium]
MIYMLDESGCFTYLNDRTRVLLGYDKNHLLGTPISKLVHDEDLEQVDQLIHIEKSASFVNRVLRLHTADNQIRHFDFEVLPIQLGVTNGLTSILPGKTNFEGVFGVARDVTARIKAEETISYQAYHDLLTNLPNRGLFEDRTDMAIAQAKRNDQMFALMFLDLDRFKLINDTLGHPLGDLMLKAIAQRLQACVREGDTLARFGGDEFTLLLPLIRGEADAVLIAEKIKTALKTPFQIEGHELFTSVSIGIALYPRDGHNLRELITHADTAMYAIKQRGKNGHQLYQSEFDNPCPDRIVIENDLRRALDREEFTLHYQPQVDVMTGKMSGLEALVRWDHPEQGQLLPVEFIDIAEQSGMVVPLGKWVIEKAIQDWTSWEARGLRIDRIAVNISPLQIAQPSFADDVIEVLASYAMPATFLEIEITEGMLMDDTSDAIAKLRQLSEHGINIAIDDFGTGYSSLSYLKKFPLRTLKIDRAFIEDIESKDVDAYLVNAIVSIAKGLELELVAEGVETWAQLEYLKARGCDKVQGFLFSKAVTANEVERLVRADNVSNRLVGV